MIRSSWFVAFEELRRHPLRTGLTVAGVTIAVATVVGVGALLGAARRLIGVALADAGGVRRVAVYYHDPAEAANDGNARVNPLTTDDSRAVRRLVSGVDLAALRTTAAVTISSPAATYSVRTQAVESVYLSLVGRPIARGRDLAEEDVRAAAPVIVLSNYAARTFFPAGNPVGRDVRIGGTRFRVVGITEDGIFAGARDIEGFVPITTARFRIPSGETQSTMLSIRLRADVDPRASKRAVSELLQRRHRDYDSNSFDVFTADEARARAQDVMLLVGSLFGLVSLLCLITGGVGIMNILLSSVAERSREIGMRRAVGATARDVFVQFLIESLSFTTLSAVLGLALGYGVGALLCLVANTLLHSRGAVAYDIKPSLSPILLTLAICTSTAVGVFFGVYPARKASKINPVDALRIE